MTTAAPPVNNRQSRITKSVTVVCAGGSYADRDAEIQSKNEYGWNNADFALVIISFRVAYTLGQAGAGRFLDAVGTRTGLSVTVAFYSIAAMLTSLATGLRSFCFFRFLLGAGEAGNWPGATKAVAEWFPRRESGWAVALFDSGSSIGAAVAPFLVIGLLEAFGTWRPA